jgi:hypothetical protein
MLELVCARPKQELNCCDLLSRTIELTHCTGHQSNALNSSLEDLMNGAPPRASHCCDIGRGLATPTLLLSLSLLARFLPTISSTLFQHGGNSSAGSIRHWIHRAGNWRPKSTFGVRCHDFHIIRNMSNQADMLCYSIVFVHGLQGHPKKTWAWSTANSSQIVYWPQDFLPQSTPDARILVYGYDSKVSRFFQGAANQNSFLGHSRTLIHDLGAARKQCVCPLYSCETLQRCVLD